MISAVICEYNPFHNGHYYQLEQMKKESDSVICIMSGDFVQRGAAAIYDKFIRTKAALLSGADLVIMLPVVYSLSPAELFAFGGVSLCDKLGVVDRLYFGTECGDISPLFKAAPAASYLISHNLHKHYSSLSEIINCFSAIFSFFLHYFARFFINNR